REIEHPGGVYATGLRLPVAPLRAPGGPLRRQHRVDGRVHQRSRKSRRHQRHPARPRRQLAAVLATPDHRPARRVSASHARQPRARAVVPSQHLPAALVLLSRPWRLAVVFWVAARDRVAVAVLTQAPPNRYAHGWAWACCPHISRATSAASRA